MWFFLYTEELIRITIILLNFTIKILLLLWFTSYFYKQSVHDMFHRTVRTKTSDLNGIIMQSNQLKRADNIQICLIDNMRNIINHRSSIWIRTIDEWYWLLSNFRNNMNLTFAIVGFIMNNDSLNSVMLLLTSIWI